MSAIGSPAVTSRELSVPAGTRLVTGRVVVVPGAGKSVDPPVPVRVAPAAFTISASASADLWWFLNPSTICPDPANTWWRRGSGPARSRYVAHMPLVSDPKAAAIGSQLVIRNSHLASASKRLDAAVQPPDAAGPVPPGAASWVSAAGAPP